MKELDDVGFLEDLWRTNNTTTNAPIYACISLTVGQSTCRLFWFTFPPSPHGHIGGSLLVNNFF